MKSKSAPSTMKTGFVMYCRKSSEGEDRQAASIDDQRSVLTRLAEERQLPILRIFTESMSAKAPGRPVFSEMLSYIKQNNIRGIIVWKLDRLFRNPADEGIVRWMLQNRDIQEIATPAKIYLEADSDFVVAIEGATAQRFITDLRANTQRGIQHKLDLGIAPILAPPGYRNATDKPQGLRDIEPDPKSFPIMRRVFELLLRNPNTIQDVYKKALDLGLSNMKGKPISRTRFYYTVQNPVFYTGKFEYRGTVYQGRHKRMLSDTEFDLLQQMFTPHEKPRVEDTTRPYNGMIKCICGHWMSGERHVKHYKNGTDQTFTYYRCAHHSGDTKPSYISMEKLDQQILDYLSKVALKRQYVDLFIEWLGEKNKEQKTLRDAMLSTLQRQMVENRNKSHNLTDLYISSENNDKTLLDDKEYKKRKAALAIERQQITDKIASLDTLMDTQHELISKSFSFATSAIEKFTKGTVDEKRAILRAFGSNLVVNGKELVITLRTPFELIQQYINGCNWIEPTDSATGSDGGNITPLKLHWGDLRDHMRTYFIGNPVESQIMQQSFLTLQI